MSEIKYITVKMTDEQAEQLSVFTKNVADMLELKGSGAIVAQAYPDKNYGSIEFVCAVVDHKGAKGLRRVMRKYKARLAKAGEAK